MKKMKRNLTGPATVETLKTIIKEKLPKILWGQMFLSVSSFKLSRNNQVQFYNN